MLDMPDRDSDAPGGVPASVPELPEVSGDLGEVVRPRGWRVPIALSELIYARFRWGGYGKSEIARMFGVSTPTVERVIDACREREEARNVAYMGEHGYPDPVYLKRRAWDIIIGALEEGNTVVAKDIIANRIHIVSDKATRGEKKGWGVFSDDGDGGGNDSDGQTSGEDKSGSEPDGAGEGAGLVSMDVA